MRTQIVAQVQMKTEADGGRHSGFSSGYRPHLVVTPGALFLGVWVVKIEKSTVDNIALPGTSGKVRFDLMYEPNVDYSALSEGASFNHS